MYRPIEPYEPHKFTTRDSPDKYVEYKTTELELNQVLEDFKEYFSNQHKITIEPGQDYDGIYSVWVRAYGVIVDERYEKRLSQYNKEKKEYEMQMIQYTRYLKEQERRHEDEILAQADKILKSRNGK